MATHQIAQGLAGLGRNGDSMLVHMQPREVAGLQALAKSHGGSLTINPHTGLAEAGFLGDILGAVAPIAAGALLGPAGMSIFDSALTAGLAVGAGAYALTGDPMKGISAGLGGYGGANLGTNLSNFGKVAGPSEIGTEQSIANVGASGVENGFQNAAALEAEKAAGGVGGIGSGLEKLQLQPQDIVAKTPMTNFDNMTSGVKRLFGAGPEAGMNYVNGAGTGFGGYSEFAKQGYLDAAGNTIHPSMWQDAATVGLPLLGAMTKPPAYKTPEDNSYKMKYEGPYTAQNRAPRMPTLEEQAALRDQGSPEYSYFGDTNPYPGFNKAPGYANGGLTELYGIQDGTQAQNQMADGYGLGRLNQLAQGGQPVYAGGGAIAFDAGGQIPNMGGPQTIAPNTNAPVLGAGMPTNTNPMQPTNPVLTGMPGSQPTMPTNPIPQSNASNMFQSQDPLKSMLNNAISDPMGRVVTKAMGGGIHSLAKGGQTMPGGYLDGAGDGMSDSIPATIDNKQPARLADGEFVIPADVVSHLGNGSTKAGAQHLYKVMDRVRQARTGTKSQGKQINPNKFLPA